MRRILKPGGIALFSGNTEQGNVKSGRSDIEMLAFLDKGHLFVAYDVVLGTQLMHGYYGLTFNTTASIRAGWGSDFEIMEIARGVNSFCQDVVVLRKK